MYIIYVLIFCVISYKTDFGFKYTNGFELLWGSIVVALITMIIDQMLFMIAFDWTGFLSKLLMFTSYDRKNAHWAFRACLSILVLIFSLTPLCSILITLLVHSSYLWVLNIYYNLLKQSTDAITTAISFFLI